MRSSPSVRRTKIRGNKGCQAALATIKQRNRHEIPNRNPKHNQAETPIHYLLRHVHILTKNSGNSLRQYIQYIMHVVSIYMQVFYI